VIRKPNPPKHGRF